MEKKHEIERLTLEQIKHLLDAAQGQSLKTFLAVAITTGLRRGELLGLRWQDLDLENEILHVRRMVSGIREVGSTETARTIALPTVVLQALKEHQQDQEKEKPQWEKTWQDLGLVFPDALGRYPHPGRLWQQYHVVFVAVGLPHLRFHDLRHSTAAFFVEMGVSISVIQAILGFRQQHTLLGSLTPITLSMQKDAMKKWDALLTK